MQLVYVDESGDPGELTPDALAQGTSRHFILSSVAIDEGEWLHALDGIARIRSRMPAEHALPPDAELHALRRDGADLLYAEFQPLFDNALKSRGDGAIDGVIEA